MNTPTAEKHIVPETVLRRFRHTPLNVITIGGNFHGNSTSRTNNGHEVIAAIVLPASGNECNGRVF